MNNYRTVIGVAVTAAAVIGIFASQRKAQQTDLSGTKNTAQEVRAESSVTLNPPQRSADLPAKPLSTEPYTSIQRLDDLVKEGSPKSLFEAAKMIGECVSSDMLGKVTPGGLPPPSYCAKANPLYFRLRQQWLEAAVASRVPGAGTEWVRSGPNGNPMDLYQRPDDLLVQQWKLKGVAILEDEAGHGDLEAIASLRGAYSGGIAPTDLVKASAYRRAFWLLTEPQKAETLIKNLDTGSQLSPDEIKAANQMAHQLVDKIRKPRE